MNCGNSAMPNARITTVGSRTTDCFRLRSSGEIVERRIRGTGFVRATPVSCVTQAVYAKFSSRVYVTGLDEACGGEMQRREFIKQHYARLQRCSSMHLELIPMAFLDNAFEMTSKSSHHLNSRDAPNSSLLLAACPASAAHQVPALFTQA